MKTFSQEQIQELADYEKKIEHPRLLQRINVLQMIACGISGKKIQIIKNLSHGAVSAYRQSYKKGGIKLLLKRGCDGREGRLSEDQKKIIKKKGQKEGFETAQEAQEFIRKEFGIEYKVRQVQYLLKKWNSHTKKQKKRQEISLTKKHKEDLK